MADDPRAPDARTAEASRRTRHGCEVVLSYEEQILNALGRLKRPRGEDFLARMKREFDAIREVLAPLYAEVKDARRLASPAPVVVKADALTPAEREATACYLCGEALKEFWTRDAHGFRHVDAPPCDRVQVPTPTAPRAEISRLPKKPGEV